MKKAIIIIICIGAAAYSALKWQYPYGFRTAFLPCVNSALMCYSLGHSNWFPKGATDPSQDLLKLAGVYTHIESLAGLSGNIQAVRKAFMEGKSIPANVISWQYYPGFRNDDSRDLAIIWEKQDGITFNGKRTALGSHAVGFADGSWRQIDGQQWEGFLSNQAVLRNTILSAPNRERSSSER